IEQEELEQLEYVKQQQKHSELSNILQYLSDKYNNRLLSN
ncbi:14710_t:CDS:1, partial [Entrophospora sp. SA101]